MDFRIQVATYGWLTDEVVVASGDAASAWAYQMMHDKHAAGEAMGGVVIRRASDPRVWDVPLGDRIRADAPIEDAACAMCSCAIADHEDAYGVWQGCRGAKALPHPYTEADVTAIARREGDESQPDLLEHKETA